MIASKVTFSVVVAAWFSSFGLAGCTGQIASPGVSTGGQPPVETPLAPSETPAAQCSAAVPRAPLRRLTTFEYNNTVRDLLDDASAPGSKFPSEELGNGFGNDADAQPAPIALITEYSNAAEALANAITAPAKLAAFAPCAATLGTTSDAAAETACAQSTVRTFAARAFRRPFTAGEADDLAALFQQIRPLAGETFVTALAATLAAVLQDPHFLYRPELGLPVAGRSDVRQPTGEEMASRLSYYLWGSMPDDQLLAAAASGELLTASGIAAQAQRLLGDGKARGMVRFFFDNLLPISGLSHLERDATQYPAFSAQIGALMRQETETFIDHQIFAGPGTWPSILAAKTTFVNEQLAGYYGIPGVIGPDFREVPLDGVTRGGLLTQGGVVAGPIHSNHTNPVTRGAFVLRKLLCTPISVPTDPTIAAQVKQPEPYSAPTARERFSLHSRQPVCAGCHQLMDPIGFALENFDAVGQWRERENDVVIDASGQTPTLDGAFVGAVPLGQRLAASEQVQACFASQWMSFAYARTLGEREACTGQQVLGKFKSSGYDVKQLLLALTQTNEFLYMPSVRE